MALPAHEQSALDGRTCALGRNAFVGERLWDRQIKVCVRLGPLSHQRFAEFLPGQPGLTALRELVRFCLGLTFDCDLTLILSRAEIPPPTQKNASATTAPRLGYNV